MERNFAEKLDLCYFSFHAADFPVVCYSQQFSRALSQNKKTEELVRTERLPLQSIRCTCRSIDLRAAAMPADLVSAGPAPGAALHACLLYARAFVRGKSSDAVWPGLEGLPSLVAILHRSFRALVSS